MNTHQWYQMGLRSIQPPNTFIGGVSATISTPALLASKLAIDVSRISNFSIVGSDIKCKITGSYNCAWGSDSTLIYYKDLDGLATFIASCFSYCINLLEVYSKTIGALGFRAFDTYVSSSKIEIIYLPNVTNFGGSVGDDQVFRDMTTHPFIIYCHQSLATNNAGGVDGDLAYAISRGATVRYVTNFTAPLQPTITSIGTIYNTAIQLIDPATSTNAIDYYEVSINGGTANKLNSGGYITGLTPNTNYNITLIAVDIFYNKSIVSNILTVSTNTTSAVPTTGLISYYQLNVNSNDSLGINNGTDTSVSYVSGKVGNAASYNGSTSFTTIADSNNLSFTNGTIDLPFSISFWVKLTANGTQFLISKASGGFATNAAEWSIYNTSGNLNFFLANKTSGYISNNFSSGITTGIWYHIVMTYSGSGTNAGMKLYKNSVQVTTYTNGNSGTYTSMSNTSSTVNFGQEKAGGGSYKFNGLLDEISIYNTVLTQTEIDLLYNSGNGITL